MKKGQVAIFILIGIFILVIIVLGVYLVGMHDKRFIEDKPSTDGINSIKYYVESCLQKTARDGVFFTSLQGGYYRPTELSKTFFDVQIPYYWYDKSEYLPSIDVLEEELSAYIKNNISDCIQGLTIFKEQGYEFKFEEPSVVSNIDEQNVIVKLNYPITAEIASEATSFDTFSSTININFKEMYNFVKMIIQEHNNNPNSIPLGFISYLAHENNFTYEYYDLEDGNVLYSLEFNQENYNPLHFNFLGKYNWSGLVDHEETVNIEPIPEFEIKEQKIIEYQVKATGENLTFTAYTNMFEIDKKNGKIKFDTSDIPNKNRKILIRAEDKYGNLDYAHLVLNFNLKDNSPKLEPIHDQVGYVGEEFYLKVNATEPTGDLLVFLDDTSLFDINPNTGEINFTPIMKGNYSIKITAVNFEGNDFQNMRFEVK